MLTTRRTILAILCFGLIGVQALGQESAKDRGRYVYVAGGCFTCHTDTKNNVAELAGGPGLVTPFGTFYAPNITPDKTHGIGKWSDEDFLRAMQTGTSPDGRHYYPVFPYVSYSQAKRRDILDLKSYIFSLPPSPRKNRPHDIKFPFSFRFFLRFWKYLYLQPQRWMPDEARSEQWNRGSYLVNALAHCGECHTPRNFLGGLDRSRWLAGAPLEGDSWAPNLTPHSTGLADWNTDDITAALEFGITPSFDVFGSPMAEVVRHGTAKLTRSDRTAIAIYLLSLPPLPSTKRPR